MRLLSRLRFPQKKHFSASPHLFFGNLDVSAKFIVKSAVIDARWRSFNPLSGNLCGTKRLGALEK